MKVTVAYLCVIAIWSTTPLAIKWSNGSFFIAAISLRVVIALAVCLAILAILRRPVAVHRSDWTAFGAGLLGLFPNMLLSKRRVAALNIGLTTKQDSPASEVERTRVRSN